MDFVCKLYGNTYAVHVTVALVGVATLNLALPAPLKSTEKIGRTPALSHSETYFTSFYDEHSIVAGEEPGYVKRGGRDPKGGGGWLI